MMSRNQQRESGFMGTAYTLQCVMIAILGGVDAQGGAGKVRSVVVAIFIVQIISSAINMFPGTEYIYQDTDMGTYPDCRHGMENVLERLKERRALCKTKAQCG